MTATLYGLKNCDTCRKARKWLDQAGIEYRFVDYRAEPVPAARLRAWAHELGGWDKLVNKASASWRQLDEKQKSAGSDEQWTQLIAAHPTLVKRPVLLLGDGSVSVGFSAERFEQRFEGR
ncbi:MAG TPA: arsenate reductase [Gammaproteobacteria bacterium]|nr:arsenate reductase [Gammaproteobacteria bacterium]